MCTWRVATVRDFPGTGTDAPSSDAPLRREHPTTGQPEVGYLRECDDGTTTFRWVAAGPSVDDLIGAATDRARRAVPIPEAAISPSPDRGGIVNLGMWLAVAPSAPVSVTAAAGGTWATVTAELDRTTFDLGNGDVVTCDGAGTPIDDPDTVEQGPCGYTFREATPVDAPHRVTITSTWRIAYQSSAGDGTLAPLTRSTSFDYPVREIQTIGIAG